LADYVVVNGDGWDSPDDDCITLVFDLTFIIGVGDGIENCIIVELL
jgi:hypothetical protein